MSELNKTVVSDSDTAKKSTTARVAAKKAKEEQKKEALIYLGPSIRGIANHCDVFSDEVGPIFAGKIKEIPVLSELLLPISQGGKKMAELKQGGPLSKLYQVAEKKIGGENDE